MAKKIVKFNEIEDALKDFAKNEKKLKDRNPYLEKDGKKFNDIVKEFCISLKSENSNEDFSWIEKFGVISEREKYKSNVNYAMPTHVHGDYKNGLIYLCLLNPGMQIGDKESYNNIKSYYEDLANKIEKSLSTENVKSDYYFYEQMDLEIKDDYKNLEKEMVKEYIYDEKTSILTKELLKIKHYLQENEFEGKWEDLKKKDDLTRHIKYIWEYFKYVLEDSEQKIKDSKYLDNLPDDYKLYGESRENTSKVTTNKVVNLELCPFRSNKADMIKNDILNTQFSEFSAYIIWYRIGKYLNDLENYRKNIVRQIEKPLFIFRSYSKWQDKLVATLHKIHNEEIDNEIIEGYIEKINLEFFYHFPNQSGMISQNNLKKFVSKDEFDGIKGLISIQN
ncbi:hypothetical protein [Anaerococcus vaginalis]|uniref:hypothetical protein n=1 Tax=Anaerococcus vaginalis TaxID=33037 RepID=UPI002907CD82|nr:hypothetical protein [Anaerococcus vaginalis]MDU5460001.1 hypothetical protein [Anaerococcus vaginalis]